jgi:phosphohistidine phosphatase
MLWIGALLASSPARNDNVADPSCCSGRLLTMKTLHLLRHAKSSWDDPTLADHERPLSRRGRAAANAIAEYLEEEKVVFDLVLCSTALRARQTLAPIAGRVALRKVRFTAAIYEAGERRLRQELRRLPEDAEAVLMVGHNPGLHELALVLADAASRARLPPLDGKFPTGALAVLAVDAWKTLRPEGARVLAFMRPKQLIAAKR